MDMGFRIVTLINRNVRQMIQCKSAVSQIVELFENLADLFQECLCLAVFSLSSPGRAHIVEKDGDLTLVPQPLFDRQTIVDRQPSFHRQTLGMQIESSFQVPLSCAVRARSLRALATPA